jgi:hypothetical protein
MIWNLYLFYVYADTRMIGYLLVRVDALFRLQSRRRETAQASAHEDARPGNLTETKQQAW